MNRKRTATAALTLALLGLGAGASFTQGVERLLRLPGDATLESLDSTTSSDQPGSKTATKKQYSSMTKRQYLESILGRNLFDSSAINKGISIGNSDEGVQTDLKVTLIATIVAIPVSYSSALITGDERDAAAEGYGIGDKIEDAEITAIEQKRVTLRRGDGSVEYLIIGEEKKRTTKKKSTPSNSTDEGIEELSENRYAIEQSVLDKHLGDLDSLSRMGRGMPHRGSDGEVDGFRLTRIRRNSIAGKLGIKNNDIVHSVNGQSLDSIQSAMGAYQSMQSNRSFSFDVTRRGQRVTLDYEVR